MQKITSTQTHLQTVFWLITRPIFPPGTKTILYAKLMHVCLTPSTQFLQLSSATLLVHADQSTRVYKLDTCIQACFIREMWFVDCSCILDPCTVHYSTWQTVLTVYCRTERLSVRLIIMQARRALVGPQCEVVYLSVTGLRLKYTSQCIVYVPFGTCRSGCHRAMAHGMEFEVEDLEDRRRRQNESRCRLTAEQKDERRQDNDDKKRLARHHLSDLLRSPTRERIGGGQHGVVSPALRASPFRTFHVLRVRHPTRMRIPSRLSTS